MAATHRHRRSLSAAIAFATTAAVGACRIPQSTAGYVEPIETCHDGAVRVVYADGDSFDEYPCGGRPCIEGKRSSGAPYATCAVRPDAQCSDDTDNVFCVGEVANECHGAFVQDVGDCASYGLFCGTARIGSVFVGCVMSHEDDLECANAVAHALPQPDARCIDDRPTACFGKLRQASRRCADEGKRCRETGDFRQVACE